MSYQRDIRIEFNHCDPAGIVFFPRYFEMINSMVENFFRDRLAHPFERITMEEGHGVPTVRLETDFRAPSYLGDLVRFTLEVAAVGRSSADFRHQAHLGNELRLEARQRIVWISAEGRAAPWPEGIRTRLQQELEKENAT
ncbi:MAG: 4-hydroxybenzoyl-CoA thioesterase [Rhodobacteraceae bacterium HLUCCA12]|nr:MAG: 4-hydroxybenzoyl-CoA thioesterase [Rhodobacteraceae bacterium HLUCCA12]